MRVEVKSVKIIKAMSEETVCFTASLYIDGKRRGEVLNRGHGACHDWSDLQARDEVERYAKTLPPKRFPEEWGGGTYQPDADAIIDELIDAHMLKQEVDGVIHDLGTRVIAVRNGQIVQSKKLLPGPNRDALRKVGHDWKVRNPNDEVLNLLPEAKARQAVNRVLQGAA